MRPRAVVTGLGAVSGFGVGAELLFAALCDGRSAVLEAPSLWRPGAVEFAALVSDGDRTVERAIPMALAAAAEAVADAGGVTAGPSLSVSVGTTLGAITGFLDVLRGGAPAGRRFRACDPGNAIALAHGVEGTVSVSSVACASGNGALGAALEMVRSGRAVQVIAGGVDVLSDFVVSGFAALKALDAAPCRPFDRARRGLNLGEGACFLVVEEEQHARARGATIRAYLDGYGAAADAHHMTGPARDGRGAAHAILAALADADLAASAIDFVSAHGTGTAFNDAMEGHALHHALGARAASVAVNSVKGAIGHTLGAAGAFEALLCVRTLETGRIAPTAGLVDRDPEIDLDVVAGAARSATVDAALSTSSGFGGINAAIVLTSLRVGERRHPAGEVVGHEL